MLEVFSKIYKPWTNSNSWMKGRIPHSNQKVSQVWNPTLPLRTGPQNNWRTTNSQSAKNPTFSTYSEKAERPSHQSSSARPLLSLSACEDPTHHHPLKQVTLTITFNISTWSLVLPWPLPWPWGHMPSHLQCQREFYLSWSGRENMGYWHSDGLTEQEIVRRASRWLFWDIQRPWSTPALADASICGAQVISLMKAVSG